MLKSKLYFSVPIDLSKELSRLLSHAYPHTRIILSFTNHKTSLGSKTDCLLSLSIVTYKFQCPQRIQGTYIGSTVRRLGFRVCEHRGVSHITLRPASSYPFPIPQHSLICMHSFIETDSSILGQSPTNSLSL